jgi:hypothetical protein
VASVTTVGTPFFRAQVGAFGTASGFAFLLLTGALVLVLLILALTLSFAEWEATEAAMRAWGVVFVGLGAALLFYMMRLSIQWMRRILRPRTLGHSTAEIHAISHPNDEAITFLKNVEKFPVEPFTHGALLRNSRAIAISWSVWLTILGAAATTLVFAVPEVRALVPQGIEVPEVETDETFALVMILALPISWTATYFLARIIFGIVPEFALRGWFNKTVGAIIRGILPEREARVADFATYLRAGSIDALKPDSFTTVLGIELARALGVGVGDKVLLIAPQGQITPAGVIPRLKQFTVVGIFEAGHFEFDSGLALVHIEDAQKLYRMGTAVTGVRLKIADMFQAPRVAREIARTLASDAMVADWSRLNAGWFRAVEIEKRMMFIILSLIVAVLFKEADAKHDA